MAILIVAARQRRIHDLQERFDDGEKVRSWD